LTASTSTSTIPDVILLKVITDNISRQISVPADTQITQLKTTVAKTYNQDANEVDHLALYLPSTGIYLKQGNRSLWTYYISQSDCLTLKKPDPPARTITVNITDLNIQEPVPVWKETTTMGLVQLLVNKDLSSIYKYFLCCDGKTPLAMNDILPKVSHFTYCPYPAAISKNSAPASTSNSSDHRKEKKTKLSRSHSHIVPSDHKNNIENTPQILFEKKWRCLAIYDTEFIHINRLFLPSLESVIHTNLPTNLKLPPEPEATTRNGLQRSDTKKRKE